MSDAPTPLRYDQPAPKRRFGCLFFVVTGIILLVLAVIGVRYAFLYTSVPFRFIASLIQKANPNVRISGISGNLVTGPHVHSIQWGSDPAHPSEIVDLRMKYSSLADISSRKQLVIEDAGVAKVHVDLADFGEWQTDQSSGTSSSPQSGNGSARRQHQSGGGTKRTDYTGGTDLQHFEIRQLLIENVLITNRKSPLFQLSIPKVSWKGFKASKTEGDPGELEIESDRLAVHTKPGRKIPMAGKPFAFQRTYEGVLQPLAFEGILQAIPFVWDVAIGAEFKTTHHFSVGDGQIESWTQPDGTQQVSVRHLDLSKYLDARKTYGAQAADLPADVNFEAASGPGETELKSTKGTLRIGVLTFAIEPCVIKDDASGDGTLRAAHKDGAGKITWSLPLEEWPMQYHPSFSSEPVLEPKELLARVFHGKGYAELSDDEKKQVEKREAIYFTDETITVVSEKPKPASEQPER